MGFLNKMFGSDNNNKNVVNALLPLVDLSTVFLDKNDLFKDKESKYIMKFYYMGFIDCFSQQMNYDDYQFADAVIEVLQHVGFDHAESRESISLFDRDANTEKAQKYLQEGAKDWMKKDSMMGLSFLLKMNGK